MADVIAGSVTLTLTNDPESTCETVTDIMILSICQGTGNGNSHGFWGNKNGEARFNSCNASNQLSLLTTNNLRNASGGHFDPTSYASFKTWNQAASATNMVYMLSCQLAAMQLNVSCGRANGVTVNPLSLIWAPGTTVGTTNISGFATVASVIAEANTLLGSQGTILSGHPDRNRATALKDALDRAINNLNFWFHVVYLHLKNPGLQMW